MKCSIINRFTICFDHLATPLQHTVDQSMYATLIQVGPGPLQNALEFLQEVSSFTFLLAFRLMLSQRFSILQDPPTATPSRTSGITSSRKPTRRWRTIHLWRNSNAFCRESLGQPGSTSHANSDQQDMMKRCREVIEADGGPINYWILNSLWCLLKVKHRVKCNKWCLKVQKHAWLLLFV